MPIKMPLARVLINKLTKAELGLLCDSYDCGDFDFNIVPELIEQDAKNRPVLYAYKCHALEKPKQRTKKRKKGLSEMEFSDVTNSENTG